MYKAIFSISWATFIDKGFDTRDNSFLIAKTFIDGIKDILIKYDISFEIHTVCQHIKWKELLPLLKSMGISHLHALSQYEQRNN